MTSDSPFPDEFDYDYYIAANGDLAGVGREQAHHHFVHYGISEGRAGNAGCRREEILPLIGKDRSCLEIGPFHKPCIVGPNVEYFDVLSHDELITRAKSFGFPIDAVPQIQFVSPTGDLSIVPKQYDYVVSSHCIEHQPDLIRHLRDVARVLVPGGHYVVIAPDKRYCFDYYNNASTIADVVEAHRAARSVHTLKSVVEHRALITHNDAVEHWAGNHGVVGDKAVRAAAALAEFDRAAGAYIDVHAWYFTPSTFRELLLDLRSMAVIPDFDIKVYNTVKGRNEFCAVLRKV